MNIFVTKNFPLFWFAVIALVLWALWGLDIVQASEDDCRDAQVAQADFEAAKEAAREQHEEVEYRVTQQQNKIDSLEQSEAALREELARLQDALDAREAERAAKRKALEVSLSEYAVQENES